MQELESVRKRATRIILSNRDILNHDALATLELQNLELRLGDLVLGFGKILLSNPSHREIVPPEVYRMLPEYGFTCQYVLSIDN